VRVPVDYRHPDGATFGIKVVELHDRRNRHPAGPLVVNNGGPGLSGINYVVGSAANLRDPVKRFDVLSFDPRGVGSPNPVQCYTAAQEDASLAVELDVGTAQG
jgi:pimeloyl-ACP methyl ester carboxylesterase